jgi:hypothetical protein
VSPEKQNLKRIIKNTIRDIFFFGVTGCSVKDLSLSKKDSEIRDDPGNYGFRGLKGLA